MSISNRAPQVTNAALWEWLKVGYEVPHGPSYPQSPNDKDFFYNETLRIYAQYDQSEFTWVNLGPGAGFHKGNLPTGTNTIELHDSKSDNFAYLFVVYNPDDPPAPLLMTDQGFLVKKDLAVGGFINSIQGALWLNYGLVGRPILSSPPCIEAMSSGIQYPSGASLPPDPEKGQLFNHSGTKKMWNGSSWITRNFSGYYDTIFLFKSDGISPAHLDLGNLTAQGAINFYDDNVRFYRDANNLRVQTPGGAGLIVEQNLWCNALAVNTSAGITGALSASSISSSGVIHGGGGSGDAFKVGDDIYIVDVDNANRLSLQGAQSRTQAGIQFGSGGMWLYRDSAYLRCSSGFVADGTVAVGTYASGGTGSAVYFNSSPHLCQGTSLMVYKTNIETLDDASWIYSLRPVTFDWKDDKDAQLFGRQIGLVAEEVQPIAPLLTFNDVQTGKLQGVIYEKLAVPMLVELQKLRHEVDELKTKLAA